MSAIAVGVACVTTMTSSISIGRSDAIARWIAARLPARLARRPAPGGPGPSL